MADLTTRQDELKMEFSQIQTWEEKYRRLIEIGKTLPEFPEDKRLDDYKVKGCQSQVWLYAHTDKNGRIQFQADSDALIVRGLVALLLRVYSNSLPDEILSTPPQFIKDLGFTSNLSPSRSNGLFSMVKQIFYYATAFKSLQTTK